MCNGKDERARGTAAQALLERGWGKGEGGVVTEGKQDCISTLMAVNERVKEY